MRRIFMTVIAVWLVTDGARAWQEKPGSQPPGPTFRTGVDLVRLDVTVVTKDGTPVRDLASEDFEVKIDGRVRPVMTSRFLSLESRPFESAAGESLARTRDFTTNSSAANGRLLILAVDHESLPSGAGKGLLRAAGGLLKALGPADRVALVTIPQPGQRIEFTRDRATVERGLANISGRRQSRFRTRRVSFTEAQGFEIRNQLVMNDVIERECFHRTDATCPDQLGQEARIVLDEGREHLQMSLTALSGLADSLAGIDGPKTVVYFSGGLGYESGSLDRFREVARKAAEARLALYVVHVDSFAFDTSEGAASAAFMGDVESGLRGLGTLSGLTGGIMFRSVGQSPGVFERIMRESTGLYVLGVEPAAGTPPTEALDIKVRVKRPGLTVRTPEQVIMSKPLETWSSPRRAVGYTLRQPRAATELPLRVTSYTFRGRDARRLKAIIAAELALSPGAAVDLTWGYEVLDQGRVVADALDSGLPFGSASTGDSIILVTACALPPGRYTLRFAVIDAAGRRGSVEHPLDVGLRDADLIQFSDLLVGIDDGQRFRPQLEFTPGEGTVSALLELYNSGLVTPENLQVEFDLRGPDGISRRAARVQPQGTDFDQRLVATAHLPLDSIAAGIYTLHATVLVGPRPVGMVRRQVTVGDGFATSVRAESE